MTKSFVALIGVFFALAACSDDSSGGGASAGNSGKGGSAAAGGDCVARCEAVQEDCGADPSTCGQICGQITETQLACVEGARCDQTKSAVCFEPGSGGSGGSGGTGGTGGTGGGSGKGGSAASSCSLFKCTKTADCPLSPCMSTDTSTNYCYGQAAKESECDEIGEPKTAFVAGSSRILCVPAGCPAPDTYLP